MKNKLIIRCYQFLNKLQIKSINIVLHGSQIHISPLSEVDILILVKTKSERLKVQEEIKHFAYQVWNESRCILDINVISQEVFDGPDKMKGFYFSKVLESCPNRLYGKAIKLTDQEKKDMLKVRFIDLASRNQNLKADEKISLGIFYYLEQNSIQIPAIYGKFSFFTWFINLNREDRVHKLLSELAKNSQNKTTKFLTKVNSPKSISFNKLDSFLFEASKS